MRRLVSIIALMIGLLLLVSLVAFIATSSTQDGQLVTNPEIVSLIKLLFKTVTIASVIVIIVASILARKHKNVVAETTTSVILNDISALVALNDALERGEITMDEIIKTCPYYLGLAAMHDLITEEDPARSHALFKALTQMSATSLIVVILRSKNLRKNATTTPANN